MADVKPSPDADEQLLALLRESNPPIDSHGDSRPISFSSTQSTTANEELAQRLRDAVASEKSKSTLGHSNANTLAENVIQQLQQDVPLTVIPGTPSLENQLAYVHPGAIIGNYQIVKLLGRGGMGAVYEAVDSRLERRVAIKIMLPEIAKKQNCCLRFLREARAAAKIEHDNVCPIYQVDEHEAIPYIVMPLLSGQSLDSILKSGRVTTLEAVEITLQIIQGLDAAHRVGLIHRDIKPDNIWLEQRSNNSRRVRLLDFGLATAQADEPKLTVDGSVLGTPSYMAPEQARGSEIDCRADLFSLGVVMYEMLGGRRPFLGNTFVAILSAIQFETPPKLSDLNHLVSTELESLVARLLEKQPERRPKNSTAVASELEKIKAAMNAHAGSIETENQHHLNLERTVALIGEQNAAPEISLLQSLSNSWNHRFWKIGLIATGLIIFGWLATILLISDSNGMLVIEYDDSDPELDLKIKDSKLLIHNEDGELVYALSPVPSMQSMPQGHYSVRVQGSDGVKLTTERFEITRNEKSKITVIAKPPQEALAEESIDTKKLADLDSVSPPRPDRFPGLLVYNAVFDGEDAHGLPIAEGPSVFSHVKDGCYISTSNQTASKQPAISVWLPVSMNRGAIVTRVRSINGRPFINAAIGNDDKVQQWLTCSIYRGTWRVIRKGIYLAGEGDKSKLEGVIKSGEPNRYPDVTRWYELAVQWTDTEIVYWIDGVEVYRGPLPDEFSQLSRSKRATINSFTEAGQYHSFEIDYLYAWDQSPTE